MRKVAKDKDHRLSARDITTIVNLITDMEVRLRPTWNKMIEIAKSVTSKSFSRQSLSAHKPISDAYQHAIDAHLEFRKTGRRKRITDDLSADEIRDRRIASQAADLARQAEEIEAYQDLLVRFIGNAVLAGITQERLEAPLATRDEWRSDLDRMADRTKEARRRQRRT